MSEALSQEYQWIFQACIYYFVLTINKGLVTFAAWYYFDLIQPHSLAYYNASKLCI